MLLALLTEPLNLISEQCKIVTEQTSKGVPAQRP